MSTASVNVSVGVPDWEPKGQWLSPAEYAVIVGRSKRTVMHWCATGVLDAFHVPYFKDRSRINGAGGRWWIKHVP